MRLAGLIALALFLAIDTAAARCFTIWKYPTPQRCWTALAPHAPLRMPKARINVVLAPRQPAHAPEIPLPGLSDIEWGKAPDDDTRGRLLLRVLLTAKEEK